MICKVLRGYCLQKEWASNLFAVIGVTMFLATIFVTIEYQRGILVWLGENILVNGAIFGLICIANVFFMATSLCLGFSECAREERLDKHAFRGRGTGVPLFPGILDWMDHLGTKRKAADEEEK